MFKIANRVKETSSTSGTGSVVLNGALGAFQTFSAGIGDGNTTFYTIENNSNWEVGQGTYDAATNSLSRDTVLSSSAGGIKITLEGTSTVFCTLPAEKPFIKDTSGDITAISGIYAKSGVFDHVYSSGVTVLDDLVVSGDVVIDGVTTIKSDINSQQELNSFNIINSGDIISSGFLTMVRDNSAGNFFHAYKDTTNQTLALHVDENISPLWKLGLKSTYNSQTEAPSYAYIYARDGSAGVVGNTSNYFSISASNGFLVHHGTHTIFSAESDEGVFIDGLSPAYPTLTVQAPIIASTDIQRWEDSNGVILSKVDKDGSISGALHTHEITFADGTTQTTSSVSSKRTYNNISSDFSMSDNSDVVFMDTSSSSLNVYLPTAVSQGGKELMVKMKAGSNSGVLVASGSQTIDGESQFALKHINQSITLISDNSNWFIT